MERLKFVVFLVVGAVTSCVGGGGDLMLGLGDEIINERVLVSVALRSGIIPAAKAGKAKQPAQCIQLVHQLDNPDSYAYAVNFHDRRCDERSRSTDDGIVFSLRLDPPLDLRTTKTYTLIAEDLAVAEVESWIPVGSLRVESKDGHVQRAAVESLCVANASQAKNDAAICQLEVSESGVITNINIRASGNAIGLNHAID